MSATGYKLVDGWTIDRGRNYELDKTSTGTATITTVDTTGTLDPTNSSGPFYGKLDPMNQAGIALQNPVTHAWSPLFRGFTSGLSYDLDITKKVLRGKIDLVDALDILSRAEMVPGQVRTTPPNGSEGDIYYAAQPVNDRLRALLADGQWNPGLTEIYTGNVNTQQVGYPPRSTILAGIDDAADSEFPGVANRFISKHGYVVFHGRKARFNPTDPQYGIGHWYAGDTTAVNGNPTTIAPIASLEFARDGEHLYNAVLSTPQNIKAADIAGQLVTDATSIGQYGMRSLSFENLLTLSGKDDGLDANQETKLFATYYVDNYKDPRTRINSVTFKPKPVGDIGAAPLWALMCGVELGDLITITTTHPGGGGFDEDFFVEGIHYTADYQLPPPLTNVELTLDLSPRAYYDTDPFT
jgi:hypothetical protein